MDYPINQTARLDERELARNQERCHAMRARPDSLRDLLNILAIKLSSFNTTPDSTPEILETLLSGLRLMLRNLLCLHERHDIVIRIVNAKLDICSEPSPQTV